MSTVWKQLANYAQIIRPDIAVSRKNILFGKIGSLGPSVLRPAAEECRNAKDIVIDKLPLVARDRQYKNESVIEMHVEVNKIN